MPHPSHPDLLDALQDALAASEARFLLLCQVTQELVWSWDAETGEATWIANAHIADGWGLPGVVRLDELHDTLHPSDLASLKAAWRDHRDGVTPMLDMEVRLRHAEDGWHWIQVRGRLSKDADGRIRGAFGVVSDVHASRAAEDRVAWFSQHDPLTGLPNRASIQVLIEERLRSARPFSALLVDLDRFKALNRTLGPLIGDEVLGAVAGRLEDAADDATVVGRLAADQFILITPPGTEPTDAEALAREAISRLSHPVTVAEHPEPLPATACVGVVHVERGWGSSHDVLRDVEQAVVQAKRGGPLSLATFEAPSTSTRREISLEAELRRAVHNGELTLHYQPIVELPSRRVVGFEALVRWFHPERGPIPPGEFIPLAEQWGLMRDLGRFVLDEACRTLATWRQSPVAAHLRMNVNLSAVQFRDRDLVDQVRSCLDAHPGAQGYVNLELTETALLERPQDQARVLQQLRDLDCEIHIDDFGTGYSSLSNLVRLPVDALKVDREFVGKAERDPRSRAVVHAVARMADELGLALTAEGIETEAQVRLIAALGRAKGQGYLFSRPLPAQQAIEHVIEPTTVMREAS